MLQLGSPSGLYGAERWILALVRHLSRATVETVVAVIRDDPTYGEAPLCKSAKNLNLQTVHFESHGKLSLSSIKQIREFIVKNDIDILHTHGYKTDIIGLFAVRGTRCRIISTPHGWSTKAGFKLQCYEFLDRMAFLMMDAVVPLSPRLHDGLLRIPGLRSKLHLIRNGVDLNEIEETPREAALNVPRHEEDTLIVGYVGQLIRRKGVNTLIRAFDSLQRSNKQLWIIGEGPQRSELEQLTEELGARNTVRFLGFREDRIALMKHLDVFVLPSSQEGIPRCLLESMAAGIPIIATQIPGCTDLVRHEITGLLFDHGNVPQLAESLVRMSGNDQLCSDIVRNARGLVTREYSAAAMAAKYERLYRGLVDSRDSEEDDQPSRSLNS